MFSKLIVVLGFAFFVAHSAPVDDSLFQTLINNPHFRQYYKQHAKATYGDSEAGYTQYMTDTLANFHNWLVKIYDSTSKERELLIAQTGSHFITSNKNELLNQYLETLFHKESTSHGYTETHVKDIYHSNNSSGTSSSTTINTGGYHEVSGSASHDSSNSYGYTGAGSSATSGHVTDDHDNNLNPGNTIQGVNSKPGDSLQQFIEEFERSPSNHQQPHRETAEEQTLAKTQAKNAHYNFVTVVDDNISGNYQKRSEVRANGKVYGMYEYDDGHVLTTEYYVADENGFRVYNTTTSDSRKKGRLGADATVLIKNDDENVSYRITKDDIHNCHNVAHQHVAAP